MYKIIITLILLTSFICAEQEWRLKLESPKNLSSYHLTSQVVSPSGQTIVSLYTSKEAVEEGEMRKEFLQIGTTTKNWWLYNDQWYVITKTSFIDNTHLLALYNSNTVSVSSLIDLKTKKQTIFFGTAEYIKEGKNKGLFIIRGSKYYFPAPEYGAFWVNELRNKKGELVKVLSLPKNDGGCIPLKTILSSEKAEYPSLQQNMSDCVYVDR